MEVNTSAGPATITVTASSQEELNQKVEAEKDKSESWQPVTDMINGKGILDTPWTSMQQLPLQNSNNNHRKTEDRYHRQASK